jgi:hypothetical protein
VIQTDALQLSCESGSELKVGGEFSSSSDPGVSWARLETTASRRMENDDHPHPRFAFHATKVRRSGVNDSGDRWLRPRTAKRHLASSLPVRWRRLGVLAVGAPSSLEQSPVWF